MRTGRSILAVTGLVVGLVFVGCGPVGGNAPETCSGQTFCGGHGTCDDSSGTEVCTCHSGYVGAACQDCDYGYLDNGSGVCEQVDQCTYECGAQNRECIGLEPDLVCGDCLPDYYEQGGVCLQACAADSHEGELVPLDLYVMLDRSSSMNDAGKWGAVVSALQGFVAAPDTAGIGMGLQFFPVDPTGSIPTACSSDSDCGFYGPCLPAPFSACGGSFATDTSCDPADYSGAQVPIQVLPGVATAITNSLNAESAGGSATPTEPAMGGAVTYATAWAQAHPDHLTFIVFATDGDPTGCMSNSTSGAAALAQSAAAGSPSVKTFVIGVGDLLSSLNEIAVAGGTGQAYIVDTGGNVTQQFIDALNEIRSSGACLFQIPQPEQGQVDHDLINVNLVDPTDPTNPETVLGVGTQAGCDPSTGGWYYDDPANPQLIHLCPATCDQVRLNDLDVEVLVGCATIVN